MKCIKVIKDEDFGLISQRMDNPKVRYGARGIVFNNENKIAILNKQEKKEYKLVGGGIDETENPIEAFKREVLEESGCQINIIEEIGTIEEIKTHDNFKQISYVFVSEVIGNGKKPEFTEKELEEGARILWLDFEIAMNLIKESESQLIASNFENVYHSKFIVRRDYEILKYYKIKIE